MKRLSVLLIAGLGASLLGACSPGTADCDANTVLVTIKCGEAMFTGGDLEITRPLDGKSFAKSTAFACPGDDYVFKLNVADYKKGDAYRVRFTPAIAGVTPFSQDKDAVAGCLPWTVVLPAFASGTPDVDAAVIPSPGDDANAAEQEAGLPSVPGDNKEDGTRCSAASECKSGFCADGVCCESECLGACKACNLTASPGICSNVAKGIKPTDPKKCDATLASTCGLDGTCDGEGACAKYPDGTLCESGTCSGSGTTGRKVCQSGACASGSELPCAPFACNPEGVKCFAECANNDQCAAGTVCVNKSCGKKPNGALCQADTECSSQKCADGFCCNATCKGACESCGLTGTEGQCTAIAKGVKDPHNVCMETNVSTCGTTGTCDGARGCSSFEANTVCKAASCVGTTFNATAKCDGAGTCAQGTMACGVYACTTTGCKTSCAGDADCVGETICKGTQCVAKAANGSGCGRGAECGSGFCADGVCCNASCDGACKSCGTGTCRDIQGEDPGMCSGTRTCSGGCKLKDAQPCNADGDCASGTCRTWYLDDDRDDYGRNQPEKVCGTAPPGPKYVLIAGDCCDIDARANPRPKIPTRELMTACNNGDFDCDGKTLKFVSEHDAPDGDYRPLRILTQAYCDGRKQFPMCSPGTGEDRGYFDYEVPDSVCGTQVEERICSGPSGACYIFPASGGVKAIFQWILCY